MKVKSKLFRQGDVLIERISEIPAAAKPVDKKGHVRIILAHGGVTGHHHSVDIAAADWWKTEREDEHFIAVKTRTAVIHQEHAPVELPRGKYRITRQREYSPAEIRRVQD